MDTLPPSVLEILKQVEDTSVQRMIEMDDARRARMERANSVIAEEQHDDQQRS